MGVGQVNFLTGIFAFPVRQVMRLTGYTCFSALKALMNQLFVSFQTKSYSFKISQNIDDGEICSLYTPSPLKGTKNLCLVLQFGIKRLHKKKWRSKILSILSKPQVWICYLSLVCNGVVFTRSGRRFLDLGTMLACSQKHTSQLIKYAMACVGLSQY